MTKGEVAKLFAIITYAYSNFTVDEGKITIWHDFLKDYPFEKAQKNLRKHIDTNAYPPTIAEIKRKDPQQFVDHEQLKIDTQKRLRIMDEWAQKATPPPKILPFNRGGDSG